jgi:hypothetical protein
MEIINRYEPMTEARENGQLLIDGNFTPLYSNSNKASYLASPFQK